MRAAGRVVVDTSGVETSTECFVYRFFDSNDRLLYVGATENMKRRLGQHASTQPWWDQVARIATEAYLDRTSALTAEAAAIRTEHPLMNFVGTEKAEFFGSETRSQLVDFFSQHPDTRQIAAVRALGIERAVVSHHVRTMVKSGVLVAGNRRTYAVDRVRYERVEASLEDASRRVLLAVPTPSDVAAAVKALESEIGVHLIHYFAENPGRLTDAGRALGVDHSAVAFNVRALLEVGILVAAEGRTYQVDRARFQELIRALEDFGPRASE